jgi:hypothetical protein
MLVMKMPPCEAVARVHHAADAQREIPGGTRQPGVIRPMKSDSIWKSMSLACGL